MAKARRTVLAIVAALAAAVLVLGGVAFAQEDEPTARAFAEAPIAGTDGQLRVEKPGVGDTGPLSAAQKQALSQGYLVPDEEAYKRAKAEAAERAERFSAQDAPAVAQVEDPQTFRSWEGLRDRRASPSDSTGAIGPSRYIELINLKYGIYDRSGNTPIDTGDLNELAGTPPFPEVQVFDPQIIWDPSTRRFYYVADAVYGETDTRLAFGFSKTANPSSAADFCKYSIRFGTRFPDYPKLGDTKDLLLVGVNSFDFGTFEFLGSDLVSITKPPAGNGCPDRDQFTVDKERGLQAGDGGPAFTPVPANQIDTGGAGYVVAIPDSIYINFFAQHIAVFRATEGSGGTLRLSGPRRLRVPTYFFPPQAPQPGTRYRLDTLDGRMTQAVLAKDPARGGKQALWTQHTVQGGSGAEVRWYEIDPAVPSQLQKGRVSGEEPGDYTFNAAISPDRQVNGDTARFGSSMVLGFNTSSVAHPPDIRMVSKVGDEPTSKQVLVKASPTSLTDWSCFPGLRYCRWGDYSAATPDPSVPEAASTGRVWLTNQWVKAQGEPDTKPATWGTWNWAAAP
jgi:hypothetical protein